MATTEEQRKRRREITAKHRAKKKAADPTVYFGTRRDLVALWRKNNPEKYREQHLLRRYGITLVQHDELLARQNGSCATCNATEPGGKGAWHVDHCHSTMKIRGILCRACNAALGQAKDSPQILRNLANYLEGNPL